jgi:hypothetical protein
MHARIMRKTAILGSSIFLVLVTAGVSVAGAPFLTSGETLSQGQIHPVATSKVVKSTLKRKRPSLVAAATVSPKPAKSTLLPAVVQPDITEHHQKLADSVFRALPAGCRDKLKNFYVQYGTAKNRGLGGKTTIILTGNVSDEEFVGLLTHECAHVIHSNWMGSATNQKTAFKDGKDWFYSDSPVVDFFEISWMEANVLNAKAKKADFVSGYGQSDAFEDFAEAFAMYVLHRDAFVERAKTNTAIAAKLEWMKKNLPMSEDTLGTSRYVWEKTVPWDVTKLLMTLTIQ